MRVLLLSAWFPYPPDNGARIRTLSLMRSLSHRHEVHLISLLQEDSRPEDAERLEGICRVVSLHRSHWFRPRGARSIAGFFSKRPRSFVDTFDPSVARAVADAISEVEPDVIVASTLGVAEYVPHGLSIPTVLDEHNCEYAVLKRSAMRARGVVNCLRRELGWRKFARWEAGVCREFDAVVTVSRADMGAILAAAPDLERIEVVPNGVDIGHFDPAAWRPEDGALVYNGALTYGANLDAVRLFASAIYPILARGHPQARLRVTGRTSGVDLSGIADCPGIELTGYVDDIREVLSRSAACVVPLIDGGGSRLKILEAMAAGVPVVSTSVGAEGIEAEDGRHLLIADTPAGLAAAIDRILTDRSTAANLGREGRALVEQRYAWSSIGEQFTQVVESAAAEHAAGALSDGIPSAARTRQ